MSGPGEHGHKAGDVLVTAGSWVLAETPASIADRKVRPGRTFYLVPASTGPGPRKIGRAGI